MQTENTEDLFISIFRNAVRVVKHIIENPSLKCSDPNCNCETSIVCYVSSNSDDLINVELSMLLHLLNENQIHSTIRKDENKIFITILQNQSRFEQ